MLISNAAYGASAATMTLDKLIGTGAGATLQLTATTPAAAALDYRGVGETVTKPVVANGTGNAIVLANNTAGNLVINFPFAGTSSGTKIIGNTVASAASAEISQVITGTGGLTKMGSGTWLYDPAPASFGAQPTGWSWLSGGAANSNTYVVSGGTGTIMPGMTVSGGNTPGNTIVTAYNSATNTITLSNSIGTTMVATPLTFGALSGFTGDATVTGGTLQVKPTAISGNGGALFANTQKLVFGTDPVQGTQFAGGNFQLVSNGTLTYTANLSQTMGALTPTAGHGAITVGAGNSTFSNIVSFASLGTRVSGATLNFAPAASLSGIQFVSAPSGLQGIIGGFAYVTNPTTGAIDFAATPAANANVAALAAATPLPASGSVNTLNYLSSADLPLTGATPSTASVSRRLPLRVLPSPRRALP